MQPARRKLGLPVQSRLDASSAVLFVTARNIDIGRPVSARRLPGGVSSDVFAVDGPHQGVVVKRSLSELRVKALWRATRERTLTEARAIRFARETTPTRVPRLVDVDATSLTLAVERAPRSSRNWREALLAAPADPEIGAELGRTLAQWHRASWMPWPRAAEFDEAEAFEQLRLRPFHGTVASRLPALAHEVERYANDLRSTRECLVHGDFSPKNVLVGPNVLWIIDFEVAHVGNPVFDVAFLGAHLILTAIARPAHAASLRATWLAFDDEYRRLAPESASKLSLGGHVACVILARTDGLSPEPGLAESERARARALATRMLSTGLNEAGALWAETG